MATAPIWEVSPGRCCMRGWRRDGAGFAGKRVFAFAGIGRPEKFVASLKAAGAIVTGAQFFRRPSSLFSEAEIAALRPRPGDAVLVTTEKDFVRLATERRPESRC